MASDGWLHSTLGDVAKANYGLVDGPFGSNLPASEYILSGVPVIRGSNLSLGQRRFNADEFVYVSEAFAQRLARSFCHPDDIIFTKKGTLGQTGIVPTSSGFDKFLLSSNQMKLSVDPQKAVPLFVYYFVSAPANRLKIIQDSTVTGVPKTNLAYLRDFPIFLPPLEEQKAISEILGALDEKIDLNRTMNETLEAMAQALFKSWFVDFDPVRAKTEGRDTGLPAHIATLFPDSFDDSELGEIPKGWAIGPLLEQARLLSGGTPKTDRVEYWEGGDILWASAKDVSQSSQTFLISTDRNITRLGLEQSATQLIPKFATVVVARGATTGRMVIFGREMAMNQTCYALVSSVVSPFSLYCLLRHTMPELVHAAHGSVFDTITTATFNQARVTKPSDAVKEAFEEAVRPLFERILSNSIESETLISLRGTLLPKLISGEIRVAQTTQHQNGVLQ